MISFRRGILCSIMLHFQKLCGVPQSLTNTERLHVAPLLHFFFNIIIIRYNQQDISTFVIFCTNLKTTWSKWSFSVKQVKHWSHDAPHQDAPTWSKGWESYGKRCYYSQGHMFFVRILGLHTISIISLHQEPIMHRVRSLPTNTSDLYEACTHLICCNDGVSTNCLC